MIEETFDSIMEVARVLKVYYTSPMYKSTATVPPWSWEMSLNVPPKNSSIAGENSSFAKSKPRPIGERGDFASASFYFVVEQLMTPGVGVDSMDDVSRAFAYFWTMDTRNVPSNAVTAGNLVRNSMVCDFEAVTFCQKKDGSKKNLVVSFILAYVVYIVSSWVLDATFITQVISPMWKNVMLLALVPWLGFQLAYGVGPTCFPMVPTCILQDVVLYLQMTVPVKLVWPNSVQRYPGCIDNMNSTVPTNMTRADCLVSCRGAPFHFRSWESSLSWVANSLIFWKDPSKFPWPHSLLVMPGAY